MNEIQIIEEKIKAEFEKLKTRFHEFFSDTDAETHDIIDTVIDDAHGAIKDTVAPTPDPTPEA